jgi:hypothetical protein
VNSLVVAIPFVIPLFSFALYSSIDQYIVGAEQPGSSLLERTFLPNTIHRTTLQQVGELDENEPITDLPVIDSPCQSPCPRTAEMCIYMCV